MSVLKISLGAITVTMVLAAGPAFAQQPPAQQPPATQPPAQQPPAAAAPKPTPQPPAPFPQDSKFAFVDINAIAANSVAGKEASTRLKALNDKKLAEVNEKNKQLQALQTKLNTGGSVLNDQARTQLEKDIDRTQRDIQFAQQNAQAEINELQQDLQSDFQKKLLPIIDAIAKEKGLYAVFSAADAGAAYIHPGLDLSSEVIKRLDATAPKK
jgi:outer membrane protein